MQRCVFGTIIYFILPYGRHILIIIWFMQNREICRFPSSQFYSDRLETVDSSAGMVEPCLKMWLQADVPHVFCHVDGEESFLPVKNEDGNQRSVMNKEEVQHIVSICIMVMKLKCSKRCLFSNFRLA